MVVLVVGRRGGGEEGEDGGVSGKGLARETCIVFYY